MITLTASPLYSQPNRTTQAFTLINYLKIQYYQTILLFTIFICRIIAFELPQGSVRRYLKRHEISKNLKSLMLIFT